MDGLKRLVIIQVYYRFSLSFTITTFFKNISDELILVPGHFPRATGDDTRSLCTTVCKWTYLGHAHMDVNEKEFRNMEACGWDDEFWEEIGLGDLVDGHHAKIGMILSLLLDN